MSKVNEKNNSDETKQKKTTTKLFGRQFRNEKWLKYACKLKLCRKKKFCNMTTNFKQEDDTLCDSL